MSLKEKKKEFESVILKAQRNLINAPEGLLRMQVSHGRIQFYNGRKYLSLKSDELLIRALAQKRYDRQVIEVAMNEKAKIERYLESSQLCSVSEVFANLPEAIKPFVTPYMLPTEEFVKRWAAQKFVQKTPRGTYLTTGGDLVRSKAEVMIADRFRAADAPYRYEAQTWIGGREMYPDFTVMNRRTGKVFIFEHFGMMDDEDYRAGVMWKQAFYARNGYVQGKNFLYTQETQACPLDMTVVDAIIEAHLK